LISCATNTELIAPGDTRALLLDAVASGDLHLLRQVETRSEHDPQLLGVLRSVR